MNMITVIVPVYKVEQYLDHCIQSILDQTYTNLEIIMIDDGSPDNCPKRCDAWVKKDSRIRVIHKENGGLSDARNVGLKEAKGDLIAFVDSDDWIAPELYERLVYALEIDQSDIAACSVEIVWGNATTERQFLTTRSNHLLNRQEAMKTLLEESLLKNPVWYKLYKREIIQDIWFENRKQHEDVYWSYQVIGNAERVSIIDYIGYYYMQRPESIMGIKYSPKRLDVMEAYERRYRYISREFPELENQARLDVFSNCIYHGQMILKYLKGNEQRNSFNYVNRIKKKYPIRRKEYKDFRFTHRLWLDMAKISLKVSCTIKNFFGVGF